MLVLVRGLRLALLLGFFSDVGSLAGFLVLLFLFEESWADFLARFFLMTGLQPMFLEMGLWLTKGLRLVLLSRSLL